MASNLWTLQTCRPLNLGVRGVLICPGGGRVGGSWGWDGEDRVRTSGARVMAGVGADITQSAQPGTALPRLPESSPASSDGITNTLIFPASRIVPTSHPLPPIPFPCHPSAQASPSTPVLCHIQPQCMLHLADMQFVLHPTLLLGAMTPLGELICNSGRGYRRLVHFSW